jgi:hypothetical protein
MMDILCFVLSNGNGTNSSTLSQCRVWSTFGPPKTDDNLQVDHVNRIKHHNCVCNLRYVTPSEQNYNRDTKNMKGPPRKIALQDRDDKTQIFDSVKAAAIFLQVTPSAISNAMKRKKRIKGYWCTFVPECDVNSKKWKTCKINDIEYKVSLDGWIVLPSGRMTIGSLDTEGYRVVGTKSGQKSAHFFVLYTFDPRADYEDLEINHKDKNRSNNHLSNLEWVTRKEQMIHAVGRAVEMWTLDQKTLLKTFKSISDAARETDISAGNIGAVCRKKHNSAGGYYWKFVNTEEKK